MNKVEFDKQITNVSNLSEERISEYLLKRNFPKRFINWTWEDVTKISDYSLIYNFINTFPDENKDAKTGLYLYSPSVGSGKTLISILIAKSLIYTKRINKALFIEYSNFIDKMREGKVDYDEFCYELSDNDIIIIDDVGKEYSTPWATAKMYGVFNHIYNSMTPIIMTSNYNITDLFSKKIKVEEDDDTLKLSIKSRMYAMMEIVDLSNILKTKHIDNRVVK